MAESAAGWYYYCCTLVLHWETALKSIAGHPHGGRRKTEWPCPVHGECSHFFSCIKSLFLVPSLKTPHSKWHSDCWRHKVEFHRHQATLSPAAAAPHLEMRCHHPRRCWGELERSTQRSAHRSIQARGGSVPIITRDKGKKRHWQWSVYSRDTRQWRALSRVNCLPSLST